MDIETPIVGDTPFPPRVLVADTDSAVRALYQRVLHGVGCDVIKASDGHDALVKALDDPPTFLITELELPVLDGASLCEVLRRDETTADMPVLVVTAENRPALLDRARNAGAHAVLAKPASFQDVLRESRRLLAHTSALHDRTRTVSQMAADQVRQSRALRAQSTEYRRATFVRNRWTGEPPKNRILAALSDDELGIVTPHLTRVRLQARQILHRQGQPLRHLYFPDGGMVSLVTVLCDGTMIEGATVGKEGIVGAPAFFKKISVSPFESIVHVGDADAMMISTEDWRRDLGHAPGMHRLMEECVERMVAQVLQSNACNAVHTVQQRCARWLLTTSDHVKANEFPLSQEFLAQMLAVQRPTVSEVAGVLQDAGMIQYRRGRIRVLDRQALEATACECYPIIRTHLERIGHQ